MYVVLCLGKRQDWQIHLNFSFKCLVDVLKTGNIFPTLHVKYNEFKNNSPDKNIQQSQNSNNILIIYSYYGYPRKRQSYFVDITPIPLVKTFHFQEKFLYLKSCLCCQVGLGFQRKYFLIYLAKYF